MKKCAVVGCERSFGHIGPHTPADPEKAKSCSYEPLPNDDHPPQNTYSPENKPDILRSKDELVGMLGRYRENLAWYVEERNRLIEELGAFKREQQARLDMKKHHERDYPE
jgi:hypothetical protein